MREAIDPDEGSYYQAIVWIAPERPDQFDALQRQSGWAGVRWYYATLDTLPNISECATALVVLQSLSGDELVSAPDVLHSLEMRGTLVGAVIVYGPHSALAVDHAWREQFIGLEAASQTQSVMPLIVAVDVPTEVCALLMLFNQLTYAAMMVCVDWFDVRVAASEWGRPCCYRRIVGNDFDDALTIFNEQLLQHPALRFLVLVENDFNLEHCTTIGDATETISTISNSMLFTLLAPGEQDYTGEEIHWLQLLPEVARAGCAPQTFAL